MSMQTPLPSPTGGSTPPQGLPTPTPSPVKNVAPNVKTPKLAVPTPKPGVDPAAQMLADNLDALHNSGYSYLEPLVQTAFAKGASSPTQAVALAKTTQQASIVGNPLPAINHLFSDPNLQKLPTKTQQIQFWFNGTMGSYPIAETDVRKIQQDMIAKKQAFVGATPTGAWTPEWQNAFVNSSKQALANLGPGNMDSKTALHNLLNQGLLSTALNSVYATVKSLPRSIMNLMGDTVSGSNNLNPLLNLVNKATNNSLAPVGQAISNAQIFPGKPTQKQTTEEYIKSANDRTLEDIGTALSFIPIGRVAFGTKEALSVASKQGLTKVLPFSEVAPKFTILKSIQAAQAAGTETVLPKILPRVIANSPITAWMYHGLEAGVAKSAPAQMVIRNTLAQRLRLPLVQATNKIIGKTIVAGALETGIGNLENKFGPDTGLDTAIHSIHPVAGNLATALDLISAQANPGGVSKDAIASYSADVANGSHAMRQSLDELGVLNAFQKANPEFNLDQAIADHGAASVYQHINDQLNKVSAMFAAEEKLNPLKAAGPTGPWAMLSDEEKAQKLLDLSHSIWMDSVNGKGSALHNAREAVTTDQNALETGFRIMRSQAMADTRESALAKKGTSTFDNYMNARKVGDQILKPEVQKYLIHPGTVDAFKKAKAAIEPAPWETAVEGAPKIKLDKRWVETNNPVMGRGVFGLARIGSVMKEDAIIAANGFKEALTNGTVAENEKTRLDIARYLINEFGIDTNSLNGDTQKMLDAIYAKADTLAVKIHPVIGAPVEVQNMFKELAKLGYQPVVGTDIGHYFTKDLMGVDLGKAKVNVADVLKAGQISEATQAQTARIASKLGLSPRLSDSSAVSARASIETNISVQTAIDAGKIKLPPGFNASRTLSWLRKGLDESRSLTKGQKTSLFIAENILAPLKAGGYRYEIKNLMDTQGLTEEGAMAKIIEAKKAEMGIRDASNKEMLTVLMRPMDDLSADLMGVPHGTPLMDKASATAMIQAVQRARVKVPSEMIGGLAKAEDWLYAGLGIAGNTIKIGGKEISGATIPNIPAYFLNMRNRVRFQESILFAYRRVFKTMSKGITEGVPPTFYPGEKMRSMGIDQEAEKLYTKMYPKENAKNIIQDDVERLLNQSDLYNLYSPRDFKKWVLYHVDQAGYKGQDALDKVERVMGYGERTAAEKSLNAVFYPFSFNKTLMRQFGGYLLTHPGQRLVAAGMLNLYDTHDGPKMRKWLEDNMPLIKEVEKLNAFEHGTGLGGFGGINMPYVQPLFNAFATMVGPKQISYMDAQQGATAYKTLQKYIPLLKSFNDVITEGADTARTGAALALRTVGQYSFGSDTVPRPQYLMPAKAQQSNAWDYRTNLITQLGQVLDYNYKHPHAPYTWGAIKNGDGNTIPKETGLIDKPINKATIGELVHYRYPAWDNTIASSVAVKKTTEADRFIGGIAAINPDLGSAYRQVDEYAKKISALVSKDNIDTATLVSVTDAFRKTAIDLAINDKNFYNFYKTHYQRLFGPLESFK